jgi:hypothetical protein
VNKERLLSSVEVAAVEPNARVLPVADLRAFLTGAWRISRTVRDARSGQDGGFEGRALFAPLPDGGLLLTESGTMRLGGYAGPAEQTYRYAFADGPGRAQVFRHDGTPFHELDLTAGSADAVHHCGADIYRGSFRVERHDEWITEWSVSGPRKDYHMVTRHIRAANDGEQA